nr:TetR/AcrR family transcriptional regulator [Deinococcus sp. JMULE3]
MFIGLLGGEVILPQHKRRIFSAFGQRSINGGHPPLCYAGGVSDPTPTPLRGDAERNRRRILDAARTVFSTQGPDATLTSVAQHAGVGAGTLYRRFPTREDLLTALYLEEYATYHAILDEALNLPDPWHGFSHFIHHMCELQAQGGLQNPYAFTPGRNRTLEAQRTSMRVGMQTLIERAQADGSLRPDLTPEDLLPIMIGHAAVITATRTINAQIWRRALALTLDGLRPQGAHPLPTPPLSQREVFRIQSRRA